MIVEESWLRLLRTERVTECEDINRGRSAHATRTSGATGPRVFHVQLTCNVTQPSHSGHVRLPSRTRRRTSSTTCLP